MSLCFQIISIPEHLRFRSVATPHSNSSKRALMFGTGLSFFGLGGQFFGKVLGLQWGISQVGHYLGKECILSYVIKLYNKSFGGTYLMI